MHTRNSTFVCCAAAQLLLSTLSLNSLADNAPPTGSAEVVIERVAITLKSPDAYRVPLTLQPVHGMTVRSPIAGTVFNIGANTGNSVQKQAELLRLDSSVPQLRLQQAQAALQIAILEEQAAATGKEAAALRVTMARYGVELAQHELDRTIVLAPLSGVVYRIHVSEGEFVMPGTPLLDLADPAMLSVEVPVDRNSVKTGDDLLLSIDDRSLTGKVDAVLPASKEFLPLQDILMSLANARVIVDNSDGRLSPGQPVRTGLIPLHPVTEVPNSSLLNNEDGTRRIQVIRDGFIRDIPVALLGPVGETHSFVSGRLTGSDELVVKSSVPLLDGTWVRPKLELLESKPAGKSSSGQPSPVPPPRPGTGF